MHDSQFCCQQASWRTSWERKNTRLSSYFLAFQASRSVLHSLSGLSERDFLHRDRATYLLEIGLRREPWGTITWHRGLSEIEQSPKGEEKRQREVERWEAERNESDGDRSATEPKGGETADRWWCERVLVRRGRHAFRKVKPKQHRKTKKTCVWVQR